ncbi:MAG: hypothetical protein FJ104_00650 [Deltaproteobacteria bacterium]|nr:hypothetical protein [Deltaproteobacteria bacterium]
MNASRALSALSLLLVACGRDPEPGPTGPQPVPLEVGQIGTVVGSGERATDPTDADADGTTDPAIPALLAKLDTPMDVAFAPDGRMFVLDWNGHKIRRLEDDGRLAFVAGTGVEGDACEATPTEGRCPATATQLNHPTDLAFGADGTGYVSAWHNAKIKRLAPDLTTVEDLCGTGDRKFEGDGATCKDAEGVQRVSFDLPSSLVVDSAGNLLVADQANQVIRRITPAGEVMTIAGSCPGTPGFGCPAGRGYEGDGGPATLARLSNNLGQGTDPQGKIALDAAGNLYIADTGNNVVRRVAAGSDGLLGEGPPEEEIITTVAGTGRAGQAGDGGPATAAELSSPTDVTVQSDGTLYIADRSNNCIRKVDPAGVISTLAGQCGTAGFVGEGSAAAEAALWNPYGVELSPEGNLFVADSRNHCVREIRLR